MDFKKLLADISQPQPILAARRNKKPRHKYKDLPEDILSLIYIGEDELLEHIQPSIELNNQQALTELTEQYQDDAGTQQIMLTDCTLSLLHTFLSESDQKNLQGYCFQNITLSNIELKSKNLAYADLSFAQFKMVTFIDCNFSEATLLKSMFEDCIFEQCTFNHTQLSRVSFQSCRFNQVDFIDNMAIQTEFISCQLSDSQSNKLNVAQGIFKACILSHCEFHHGFMYETDFIDNQFVSARFIECKIENGIICDNAQNNGIAHAAFLGEDCSIDPDICSVNNLGINSSHTMVLSPLYPHHHPPRDKNEKI